MSNYRFSSQAAPVGIVYDAAEPAAQSRPEAPPQERDSMRSSTLHGRTNSEHSGAGHTDPSSPTASQYGTGSGYYPHPVNYFNQTAPHHKPNQAYDPYYHQHASYYYGDSAVGAIPASESDTKAGEKMMCDISKTACLLWCIVAFVVVSGAILGGVFGSGVLHSETSTTTTLTPSLDSTRTYSAQPPSSHPSTTSTTTTTTTTTTPTTTTTTTTASTSSEYQVYALPTGIWTLTGNLDATHGDCIKTINDTTSMEVWACDAIEPRQIVIKDMSSDDVLAFWMDLEGTNMKGIVGQAPTSDDVDLDNGKNPLWTFDVDSIPQMSPDVPDGCQVEVTLQFMLGRTKSIYLWFETIYNQQACSLQSGGMSAAGLSCRCWYGHEK